MRERTRRVRRRAVGFIVAPLVVLMAPASVDAGQSPEPASIDPPARPGSSSPALAAESVSTLREEHDVLITWLEPSATGQRLRFARRVEREWSQPVTIAEPISTVAVADRPSLTVIDTQAVRRTLVARTGDVVARSGDAGRTWTRLPAGALPFASFAGGDEGGYAFWLEAGEDDSATLLGTRILAGATLLDSSVAGGSGTSAAMTWDGPVVVYRDDAVEDIALIRRQAAQWTRPLRVHHVAGWHPEKKPESGPEVAALRRDVAVAWYSKRPHRPRVLVAFSSDAGRTFAAPIEVDVKQGDRVPLAFVDVALADNGDAAVLWMATTAPAEAVLNLALVSSAGERGPVVALADGLPPGAGGIPQMTRAGDRLAVTWVEGDPGRLRAVTVPLAALTEPSGGDSEPTASSEAPSPVSLPGQEGATVPDIELISLTGDRVSLTSLRGRPALVNLWATWCVPCITEMPELAALHERYGPQGLVLVGLSFDDAGAIDRVRKFVTEREIPFAIWLDPEMHLYGALRVKGLPVNLVVDRDGQIVLRREGAITATDPEVEKAINGVLEGG